MAQDPPKAPVLLEAVREWLQDELLPEASGGRAFHLRVAINMLSIVERELTDGATLDAEERQRLVALLGHEGDLDDLNRELCVQIRDGKRTGRDENLLEHLRATTKAKLRVANPRYR